MRSMEAVISIASFLLLLEDARALNRLRYGLRKGFVVSGETIFSFLKSVRVICANLCNLWMNSA